MKTALVGVGAAGIVSTVACALFLPGDSSAFRMTDVVDTSVLLGLAFGAILAVGLATMAKAVRSRKHEAPGSEIDWAQTCPKCGAFMCKRRNFCPECGADLR